MKYLEYTFTTCPAGETVQDVLAAVLAEVGFDSFVNDAGPDAPLKAYIRKDAADEEALREALADFPLPGTAISYEAREAEDRDWNEVWEQNYFQPIVVGGRCVVASTFHKDVPTAEYTITIDPRMSFGTGHHATTAQMIGMLLDNPMEGRRVLDMGCGTSILAILARMRGAARCVAIDNDEWCVRNSLENIALNHTDGIDVRLGDATALPGTGPYDVVIANINRNILLADMGAYVAEMAPGAVLFMSGFYEDDVPAIRTGAERLGLRLDEVRSQDRWACIKCIKD